jgi:uncharacterized protein (DUF58 family)
MAAAIQEPEGDPRRGVIKTRFDVAVESALALADGALRAGDRVGAIVYGEGRKRLIAPGRGHAHYLRLLDALGSEHAEPVHLDVRGLLAELERHAKRRALIVVLTDLENETHGAALLEHASMITRRHLGVCVSLQDAYTAQQVAHAPESDAEVYHQAAAIDLLEEREELRTRLEKRGIVVIEADARGLARALLDHYLSVKLRARL